MIKLICVVKRNPSLSVEEFHDHWRGRHARLISETPGVADRIVRYEQNHRSAADYKRGGDFDGVAIQWFDARDDFVAMVGDPEYQASVAPDERELLDLDGLVWILTEEEEVVIPGPEQRDQPVIKLVCMVKRRPGMTIDDFHRHWRTVHSPLNCDTPSIAQILRPLRAQPPRPCRLRPSGGSDFDGAAVEWYPSVRSFYDMVGEPAHSELIAPDELASSTATASLLLTEREETIIG